MRAVALLTCAGLATGCFGYNSGAKKWAYVGDTIFALGGAAAITADLLTKDEPCTGTGCPEFELPFGGATVAGAILLTAGIVGYVINATRPTVKTSR
jgi:hypothetical protein